MSDAPRETYAFAGHEGEERALAEALDGGRLHHAWLLTGPRRLGKATLAFRFARTALGARRTGPRPLDVDPDDPIARRIAQNAHPGLFTLERGLNERTGKRRGEITVDEARALTHFFAQTSVEGGMRIAIIDAVDELNRNAANALLKTLEEPPPRTVLLLVCHSPGAALATIRSRCRRLALRPLSASEMDAAGVTSPALLRIAKGRPGFARALMAQEGGEAAASALEDALARVEREGARPLLTWINDSAREERTALFLEIASDWLAARGRESQAPQWAEAWSALEALREETDGLDMDEGHALLRAAGVLDRARAPRS